MKPSFVTIPNVPILSTGIEYPLQTGLTTFTPDDLREIVASQDDSAIASPRLKLSRGAVHDENGYNEPAFGKVVNMRLGDNDQTIYGDYVGVPKWLADIMPVAYPNRSVEGNWDVETVTGKKWRLVVTAVELLGVHWPGCSVLEDLPLLYGDEMPEDVELAAAIQAQLATGGDPMKFGRKTAAAVNVDDVRREFYDQIADGDRYWWWIRAIELEPDQLIVDDDNGTLYRIPFSAANDEVSFEDPIEIKINYVDVAATATKEEKTAATAMIAAGLLAGEEPAAVYASRAESRPVKATQEGGDVDLESLRQRLGLPEGTSEEAVLAEVDRLRDAGTNPAPAPTGPTPGQGNNPSPEQDPQQQPGSTDAPDPTPPANEPTGATPPDSPEPDTTASAGEGTVTIDRATFEQLKQGAAAGLRLEASTLDRENDALLDQAIKDGKFPPARREHYKAALGADRAGTVELINKLAPGLVPVELRASVGTGGGTTIEGDDGGLPDEWFPEAKRNREALAAGQSIPGRGTVLQAREA